MEDIDMEKLEDSEQEIKGGMKGGTKEGTKEIVDCSWDKEMAAVFTPSQVRNTSHTRQRYVAIFSRYAYETGISNSSHLPGIRFDPRGTLRAWGGEGAETQRRGEGEENRREKRARGRGKIKLVGRKRWACRSEWYARDVG